MLANGISAIERYWTTIASVTLHCCQRIHWFISSWIICPLAFFHADHYNIALAGAKRTAAGRWWSRRRPLIHFSERWLLACAAKNLNLQFWPLPDKKYYPTPEWRVRPGLTLKERRFASALRRGNSLLCADGQSRAPSNTDARFAAFGWNTVHELSTNYC